MGAKLREKYENRQNILFFLHLPAKSYHFNSPSSADIFNNTEKVKNALSYPYDAYKNEKGEAHHYAPPQKKIREL